MNKNQVVYFSSLHPLMWRDDATGELNKAFSVLEAMQEYLLGIIDLDDFAARLKSMRNGKGEE